MVFAFLQACSSPPPKPKKAKDYILEDLRQGNDALYGGNMSPYISVGYRDFDLVHLKGIAPVDTNTMKGYLDEDGFFGSRFWMVYDVNPNKKLLLEYRRYLVATPICLRKEDDIWKGAISGYYKVRGMNSDIIYLIKEGQVAYSFYINYDDEHPEVNELWCSTDSGIVAIKGTFPKLQGSTLQQFQYCETLMREHRPYLELSFLKKYNRYVIGVEGTMNGQRIHLEADKPCLNILQGMHVAEYPIQDRFKVCGSDSEYYMHVEDIAKLPRSFN